MRGLRQCTLRRIRGITTQTENHDRLLKRENKTFLELEIQNIYRIRNKVKEQKRKELKKEKNR